MENQNPINQFNYGLALPAMLGLVLMMSAIFLKYLVFTDVSWQQWMGLGLLSAWMFGFISYLGKRRPVEHSSLHLMWCVVVGSVAAVLGFISVQNAMQLGDLRTWSLAALNVGAAALIFLGALQHWNAPKN